MLYPARLPSPAQWVTINRIRTMIVLHMFGGWLSPIIPKRIIAVYCDHIVKHEATAEISEI
jgi:hypothetical protein